jgi:hypothetical protein
MGDGACLWSDELKISQPVQHTAIRPNKKKKDKQNAFTQNSIRKYNFIKSLNTKQ